jgi:hypothetical protein
VFVQHDLWRIDPSYPVFRQIELLGVGNGNLCLIPEASSFFELELVRAEIEFRFAEYYDSILQLLRRLISPPDLLLGRCRAWKIAVKLEELALNPDLVLVFRAGIGCTSQKNTGTQ